MKSSLSVLSRVAGFRRSRPHSLWRPRRPTRRARTRAIGSARNVPSCKATRPKQKSGALGASGANATFGRYTGIDHGGAYADASGSGQYRSEDGSYANYDLERLGLASRDGYVEGGREGRYDLRVSYDGQPNTSLRHRRDPVQSQWLDLGLAGRLGPGGQHRRHERARHESLARRHRIGSPHRRVARAVLRQSQLDGLRRVSAPGA